MASRPARRDVDIRFVMSFVSDPGSGVSPASMNCVLARSRSLSREPCNLASRTTRKEALTSAPEDTAATRMNATASLQRKR